MDLTSRIQDLISRWQVRPDHSVETGTACLVFGEQGDSQVVLKVSADGDEWLAGSVISAFQGQGMVRALEWADGAVLLERLRPGEPLVSLSRAGQEREACTVFAQVVTSMSPGQAPPHVPAAAHWGLGFDRYSASGDHQIPPDLLAQARRVYETLCATQRNPRLLHGDLHHFNILFDQRRGWLAIDPKGVIAEPEFELGAWLRNPVGHPELFAGPKAVEERVACLQALLPIDPGRTLAWAFAQGVLSAIWTAEDEGLIPPDHAGLWLARVLRDRVG